MPSPGDSISMAALSVLMTKRGSPLLTVAFLLEPFDKGACLHDHVDFGHDDFSGHGYFPPAPANVPRRQYPRPGARRRVQASDCKESECPPSQATNRSIEIIKSITSGDHRRQFTSKTASHRRFMGDQRAASLGNRSDNRIHIEGLEATWVDHFDFNAFGGQLLGRFQARGTMIK